MLFGFSLRSACEERMIELPGPHEDYTNYLTFP
jgi:hypothetical protein